MFVGHYGVSFAAKKADPSVPLWVLFLAVQLLDILWAPFVLLGIEKVRIVPGITATNPLDLYYMPYTHSLVGALVWSVGAFAVYRLVGSRGRSGPAAVVGVAVFSHWVLDFVVHRPDLPLYDNHVKVGLGLWNMPAVAFGLEAAVLLVGIWFFLKSAPPRRAGVLVFGLVMLAVQAYVFFGPAPTSDRSVALTALACYVTFAAIIGLLERPRRTPAAAA